MAGPDPVKGSTIPIGNLRIQDDGDGQVNLDKDQAASIDKPGTPLPKAKVEAYFSEKGLSNINGARWKDLQSYVQHIDAAAAAAVRLESHHNELELAQEAASKGHLKVDQWRVEIKLLSAQGIGLSKKRTELQNEIIKICNGLDCSEEDGLKIQKLQTIVGELLLKEMKINTQIREIINNQLRELMEPKEGNPRPPLTRWT